MNRVRSAVRTGFDELRGKLFLHGLTNRWEDNLRHQDRHYAGIDGQFCQRPQACLVGPYVLFQVFGYDPFALVGIRLDAPYGDKISLRFGKIKPGSLEPAIKIKAEYGNLGFQQQRAYS